MAMTKREFLNLSGITAVGLTFGCGKAADAKGSFPVTKSDAEWRRTLSPLSYKVLRQQYTEPAGTSPLDHEKRAGTFVCAGCGQKLYSSATKFNSGTGWPSFYRPLAGAVATSVDYKIGVARTEVHCARCGGHLGHVFNDGPPPTGKRYCMNGAAMRFIAA